VRVRPRAANRGADLFLTFEGKGPDDVEIAAHVGECATSWPDGGRIDRVQVYTVSRQPADPRMGSLPVERLEEIASSVRGLGLSTEVFGDG
jgi:hypothetical protein